MTAVFETVRGVRRKTPKGPHSVRKPRIRRATGLVRAFGPIIGLQKIFREKVWEGRSTGDRLSEIHCAER